MTDIVIFGAGGLGKDIHFLIDTINYISPTYRIVGFYDDYKLSGEMNNSIPILGGLNELNKISFSCSVVIAIGNGPSLLAVRNKITNPKLVYPNIIHPNSCIDHSTLEIGVGNIINYGVIISRNTNIGNFNLLNSHTTIGHDVTIGSYNSLAPKVAISGNVKIADQCVFGTGSTVIQEIEIPNNVKVGAHSLIIRKPKTGHLYFGNPALKQ
jgi:sugar O-acyltransferase (sialic acid O-acetyltransferase NeuD family)